MTGDPSSSTGRAAAIDYAAVSPGVPGFGSLATTNSESSLEETKGKETASH